MKKILYMSRATFIPTTEDLLALLISARTGNAELNVTGMLVFARQNFMQILEGEADTVDGLYEGIRNDSRHSHIIKVIDSRISQRQYADWTMGFAHPDHAWLQANIPGYQARGVDLFPDTSKPSAPNDVEDFMGRSASLYAN